MKQTSTHLGTAALTLGALGVVFGDIGTSPLYTVQECFVAGGASVTNHDDVLGVVSLIFWSLMLVVTFKYVLVLMRADNHGEGGIMALLAQVPAAARRVSAGRIAFVSLLVIAGASLLFGDGIITPAISVLSAVEGLGLVDPRLKQAVVPLTLAILVVLFAVQSRGTGALGKLFGPVMLVWFLSIGALGLVSFWKTPDVLQALWPHHGLLYFWRHGLHSFPLLGSVVLAVTGGEALYADMGHFGRGPIRMSWTAVVLPSLAFCYLGQGALLWRDPQAISAPFFSLITSPGARLALVGLAALATVIASQGLISAVFSLTQQAVQLGYFPRVAVRHTSKDMEGQVYVPWVNWTLAAACIALVLMFRESARLAAAFGLAVSGTMAITSVVFFHVTRDRWGWPAWKSWGLLLLFLSFDIPFFLGTCVKFFEGGYIPFAAGLGMFFVMTTWCVGRSLVSAALQSERRPLAWLNDLLASGSVARNPGLTLYLSSSADDLPPVLCQQVSRFPSLSREILLLTIKVESAPYVAAEQRLEICELALHDTRAYRLVGHYGFMEQPDVPALLAEAVPKLQLDTPLERALYVLGRESLAVSNRNQMSAPREAFYALLADASQDVSRSYGIPPEQVIELGTRLDL